jgi:hypothetical protein
MAVSVFASNWLISVSCTYGIALRKKSGANEKFEKKSKSFGASMRRPQGQSSPPVKYEMFGSMPQIVPKFALRGQEDLQFGSKH